MIEHGFESNLWLSKVVVAQASPLRVKAAIIQLFDFMAENEGFTVFEVMDRLVQVCATGKYEAPDPHIHFSFKDLEDLDEEAEAEVEKFRSFLEGLRKTDEPDRGEMGADDSED